MEVPVEAALQRQRLLLEEALREVARGKRSDASDP